MGRLNGLNYLTVTLMVLPFLAITEIPARVGPYGTGLIELTDYDLETGRFEFLIQVVPDIEVEFGELVAFQAVGDRGSPEGRAVLWEGSAGRGDTISATYQAVFGSPGRYRAAARVELPKDPRYGVNSICGSTLFVDIGQDTVLTSRVSFYETIWRRMQIDVAAFGPELRNRGIYTLDVDSLRALAPDIFRQLRTSAGYHEFTSPPPGWSAEDHRVVPHSGPTRYTHGQDSLSYPVTKRGYHGDSSEAANKEIPERVLNRRPRHRIDITPPRDTLEPRPDPSPTKTEVPVRDLSRDSALYMEPWLLERSLRIRQKQDSIDSVQGQPDVPDE